MLGIVGIKEYLLGLLLVPLFISCSLDCSVITAEIDGLGNDTVSVKLTKIGGKWKSLDTVVIAKDGRYKVDLDIKEACKISITPFCGIIDTKRIRGRKPREAMTITLYARPNEKYNISGEINRKAIFYTVEGSDLNNELAKGHNKYIQRYLYKDMENEYFRDYKTKKERDSVYMLSKPFIKIQNEENLEYIKENLDSQLSGLYLSEQPINVFDEYYNKLSQEVKEGMFKPFMAKKKWMSDLLANNRNTKIGSMAPDFTLKDIDGNDVQLSSFRGKYVFLYFWGSW